MKGKDIVLIILGIMVVVMFRENCNGPKPTDGNNGSDTVTVTKVVHDSVPKYIPYPAPYAVEVLRTDTVPADVDTAAILEDYYTTKSYTRQFGDSSLKVTLTDTIAKNQLAGSSGIKYQILRPTVINTTTITQATLKNKLLVGIIATGSDSAFGAGAHIGLLTKQDNLLLAGYDPFNKVFSAGFFFKIKFHR